MTDGDHGPACEQPLLGGRLSAPVRVGDTVRRPARPWSSGTQALLAHLAQTGFTQAPRYLGRVEQDRDVLTDLPGEVLGEAATWPSWIWAEVLLADVGRWLRRLHDATAHWQPPATATWFTGFVDWDTAEPAHPELDLAWTALTSVPLLRDDVVASWDCPPTTDRSHRFHLLLDSYGYPAERAAFAQHIPDCARTYAGAIRAATRPTDGTAATMLAWADDLSASADAVAALPALFWKTLEN